MGKVSMGRMWWWKGTEKNHVAFTSRKKVVVEDLDTVSGAVLLLDGHVMEGGFG